MNIIERLNLIEQLVMKQTSPTEIKGHITSIREQIETYSQKADHLAALEQENAALVAENAKLKAGPTATTIPSGVQSARDRLRGL